VAVEVAGDVDDVEAGAGAGAAELVCSCLCNLPAFVDVVVVAECTGVCECMMTELAEAVDKTLEAGQAAVRCCCWAVAGQPATWREPLEHWPLAKHCLHFVQSSSARTNDFHWTQTTKHIRCYRDVGCCYYCNYCHSSCCSDAGSESG